MYRTHHAKHTLLVRPVPAAKLILARTEAQSWCCSSLRLRMRPRQRRRTRHNGRAQSGGGGTRLLLPVVFLHQQQGVAPELWDLCWKPQRARLARLHRCVMPNQLPSFAGPTTPILCQTVMDRQV